MNGATRKLDLADVVRGTARTCREQWRLLLVTGLIVFVPLGAIEALDHDLQGLDVDSITDVTLLAIIAVAIGHSLSALFGEVFFAGVVAGGVSRTRRGGGRPDLREIARHIPYLRLAIVDVLFALIVAGGIVALLVPGVVLYVWFGLAGPVVEIEGIRPFAALRRSRELVRGSFWRVAAILLPLELGTSLFVDAAGALGVLALGESFAGEWAGSTVGGIVTAPLWAAAAVIVTYELMALRGEERG